MIIAKTLFRISFFGGGTDLECFFREYGGSVISTTIDKYSYVTVRHLPPFFEYRTHLTYSQVEYVNEYDEIRHPLIREAMRMHDMHEIRLTYDADLPSRSGLGTSSSFAVGMINAFCCLKGKYVDKKRLANEAIYLERVLCQEAGGWQDQIVAAYGGLNRIDFNVDGFEVKPIIINPVRKEQLNNNLLMFFTGFVRYSSEIQEANTVYSVDRARKMKEMITIVNEAETVFTDKGTDLDEIGRLLDYSWKLKRGVGKGISTSEIDDLYDKGIKAGALGGKLLGAGGGGFLLFYVQPEKQKSVMKAMEDLLYIPFKFETEGTTIVHYTPESYEQDD